MAYLEVSHGESGGPRAVAPRFARRSVARNPAASFATACLEVSHGESGGPRSVSRCIAAPSVGRIRVDGVQLAGTCTAQHASSGKPIVVVFGGPDCATGDEAAPVEPGIWHFHCGTWFARKHATVSFKPLVAVLVSPYLSLACGSAASSNPSSSGGASTSATSSSGGGEASSSANTTSSANTASAQSSSTGSGGATSGTTTSGDVCAGQPVHCVELCEGGDCQCDCSPGDGCATPGWIESSLAWERFGLGEQAGTGVTLCHPDTFAWLDPEHSANSPTLGGSPRISFLAYAGLDHESALKYLSDQDAGRCTYSPLENYGVRFLSVDGAAAMEQSYVEPAPVCGACDPLPESGYFTVANFYLARGSVVLVAQALADTDSGLSVDILFDVAETIRIDTGEPADEASADLELLQQTHEGNCGS